MRIRADIFFECWQEIPLAHLIHGIYLWSQCAQVSKDMLIFLGKLE